MTLGLRLIRGLGAVGLLLCSVLLSTAPVVLMAPAAYAQSNIDVQGNRRVEAATIRAYFKPGPGGRLGAFEIDEAYKALFATGLFQDVNIRQAGGRIIVTVVENAVINRIQFEGNKRVKDEQLKPEIQSKERGTLSRGVVQSDVQRIVEVYRRSGRYDVTVVPKIIDLPNGRVDLVYEITEGDKTTIIGDRVRRQSCVLVVAPEGRRSHHPDEHPFVPAEHQHLRPGPAGSGPRAAAPVLPEERLYRRPHCRCERRIRSRAEMVSSSPSRSKKASNIGSVRSMSVRTCAPSTPD